MTTSTAPRAYCYLDVEAAARRDYFAATAINALAAGAWSKTDGYDELAAACAEFADALIAASRGRE